MKSRLLFWIAVLAALVVVALAPVSGQALTGDKIIGPGGAYTSLGAAITDLNAKGASGTVRFLIDADLSETGSPEITSVTLNGTNKLVIKPNTGKTPTVTFSACATSGNKGNSGLAISGTVTNVGYITIDGSNTANGTTRDMTFALNDGTAGRYVIRLNGQVDTVTIKNLKIVAAAIMATTSSGTRTYGINCLATTVGAADGLAIANCQIGSSTAAFYYAIYKPDGGTYPYGSGLAVSKNLLYAQHKGLSIWGSAGISSISDNQISVIGHPTGTYVQNSLNGIYVESWLGTVNIFNNKITSLKAKAVTQTALKPLYGIIVYYASGTTNTGQTANIYNNFISDFSYSGDATTAASEVNGIAVDAMDQIVNVYFNTIYLNGDNITTNPAMGIRVYDDVGLSANLKNNIIVNTVNHDSAYAIYCNPIVNNCLKSSDFNDVFVAGANANVGNYGGTKHKTIAAWKTGSGKDANSVSVNPANPFGGSGQLKSLADLHWVSAPAASFAGTFITGYTTDIDGDVRSAAKTTMGADEPGASTAVETDQGSMPRMFWLEQNYPNPFNPSTAISFQLSAVSFVKLTVSDVLGREVATLVNGQRAAGSHIVTWDAAGMSGGVYFYSLTTGGVTQTRKMQLIK